VVATGVAADSAVEATAPIKVNWGQQEKHFPGHPNFQLGRSTMTENPERLIERAGSGTPVGSTARGIPGFKERVDFEEVIGMWVPREGGDPIPTTIGMLHYGSRGIHIVPARP
jgi:filamentous hemagglutinin